MPVGRLAWQNTRSGPAAQEGHLGASGLGSGALGSQIGLRSVEASQGSRSQGDRGLLANDSLGPQAMAHASDGLQAAAVSRELKQVRKEKAAAVKSENYRRANELKKLEKELQDLLVQGKAHTGAQVSRNSSVLGHVDRELHNPKAR